MEISSDVQMLTYFNFRVCYCTLLLLFLLHICHCDVTPLYNLCVYCCDVFIDIARRDEENSSETRHGSQQLS